MPSLGSILSIAVSSIQAHQRAINVTSHNMANAQTEGYSRQNAVFTPWSAQETPNGVYGTGVRISDVRQVRDELLDSSYLKQTGIAAEDRTVQQVLSRVETILGEPGDGSISVAADRFFSAFSELASYPENPTLRSLARDAGFSLASRFKAVSGDLTELSVSTGERLTAAVDRVNTITAKIAEVNKQIVNYETTGRTANDFRDQRRLLTDELGSIMPIQVTLRSNGSVGVTTGGLSIVDGGANTPTEVRNVAGTFGVGIVGRSGLLPDVRGSLGGFLQAVNTEIPAIQTRVNDLATALITEVNALHQTGTTPLGNTGIDFFSGTDAATMDLSAEVTANYADIAAGIDDGSGNYVSGRNDVALALGQLRDKADLGGIGATFQRFQTSTVVDLAYSIQAREDGARVHEALAENIDVQRESVSGVSTDEELVKLIQFQTGYQAAARVISVAEEMMDTLIQM